MCHLYHAYNTCNGAMWYLAPMLEPDILDSESIATADADVFLCIPMGDDLRSPQRSSTYFKVWELHLHSFFFMVSTCYCRGMHFFSHLLGSTCNSQSISLNTWSTVSKHFWCNQSLQLPKAQTKPTKSRDFDKNAQVISWIPFVTKVMQWMVANRIHGSRHLGVETTYSKATPEGRNKLTT